MFKARCLHEKKQANNNDRPPFILALIYSFVLRRRERAQAAAQTPGSAPDRITVVITPADEETRLLQ
jgi:hypothetical protein